LFPLFATGVIDTDGKLTISVVDTSGNLSPVLLRKFATGINDTSDTGGKIYRRIVHTRGAPFWLADISENFRKNSK
jgi:hypothetical protein